MDKRSRFTKEEKLAIVKRYLEGSIGITSLAREVGCSVWVLRQWVHGYEYLKEDYFRDTSKQRSYTIEFKKQVVEYYFKTYSLRYSACKFGTH